MPVDPSQKAIRRIGLPSPPAVAPAPTHKGSLKLTPLRDIGYSTELVAHKLGITLGYWLFARANGKDFADHEKNAKMQAVKGLQLDEKIFGELPPMGKDEIMNTVSALEYLVNKDRPGAAIAVILRQNYSEQISTWYEFSLKAVMGLNMYAEGTKDSASAGAASAMRRCAEIVGLDASVYEPYATILEKSTAKREEAVSAYTKMNRDLETLLALKVAADQPQKTISSDSLPAVSGPPAVTPATRRAEPLKITPLRDLKISTELVAQKLGLTLSFWLFARANGKEFADFEKDAKVQAGIGLQLDEKIFGELPSLEKEEAKNFATAIHYLVAEGEPGGLIGVALGGNYSKLIRAWYEFGMKSALGINVYAEGMKDPLSASAAAAMRRCAATVGLEESVYGPYVTALEMSTLNLKEVIKVYTKMNQDIEKLLQLPAK